MKIDFLLIAQKIVLKILLIKKCAYNSSTLFYPVPFNPFVMRKRKPIRTGYILSLCPKCRAEFFSVPENILRRVDPLQVEKEPCDKCQVGYGYDYLITKRTKRFNNGGGGLDV